MVFLEIDVDVAAEGEGVVDPGLMLKGLSVRVDSCWLGVISRPLPVLSRDRPLGVAVMLALATHPSKL